MRSQERSAGKEGGKDTEKPATGTRKGRPGRCSYRPGAAHQRARSKAAEPLGEQKPGLPRVSPTNKNDTAWTLSKADFTPVFSFVLYLKKINSGMVVWCSPPSRVQPEGHSGSRRLAALGPTPTGLVHTMETAGSDGLGRFPSASSACVPKIRHVPHRRANTDDGWNVLEIHKSKQ